jgi:hypothetical protein
MKAILGFWQSHDVRAATADLVAMGLMVGWGMAQAARSLAARNDGCLPPGLRIRTRWSVTAGHVVGGHLVGRNRNAWISGRELRTIFHAVTTSEAIKHRHRFQFDRNTL